MLNKSDENVGEKVFPIIRYTQGAVVRLWILLGCFVLFWLNGRTPILRFDAETIGNHVFYMIMLLVFPILALNSLYFKCNLFKWSGLIIFSLLTIASLPLHLFIYSDIQQFLAEGRDRSFYRLNQIKTDGNMISIYLLGGGALSKDWVIVRQEKRLFSKLFVVSDLYREDYAENIDVRVVDADTIEINILLDKRYGIREWTAFHLKKFVYL